MESHNFRVAGRQPAGKLKATAIHLSLNIPTSIPAKISTILLDEKVHKGFGSTAFRFQEPSDDDALPGPGEYEAHHTPNFEIDKRGGSGGFASKSDRFKLVVRRSPAPNAYQQVVKPQSSPSPSTLLKRTLKTGSLHNSAAAPSSASSGLGPGSYDPRDPRVSEGVPVRASFRSQSERGAVRKPGPAPDPGTYDVRKSLIRTHAPILGRAPQTPRGVFVAPALTRLPDSLAREILRDEPSSVGPGSYNPRLPGSPKAVTSAFALMTAASEEEPLTLPGPGAYEPRLKPSGTNAGAAAFKSASENHAAFTRKNANPGPSYYKPRLQVVQESFINNAGNRWL